jgi:predicted N-acyltransferase
VPSDRISVLSLRERAAERLLNLMNRVTGGRGTKISARVEDWIHYGHHLKIGIGVPSAGKGKFTRKQNEMHLGTTACSPVHAVAAQERSTQLDDLRLKRVAVTTLFGMATHAYPSSVAECVCGRAGHVTDVTHLECDLETVVEVLESLQEISRDEWNTLTDGNPFLSHQFLHGLHTSGCASARTGWRPRFLVIRREGRVEAAMILYAKYHSRGEYVFDHAWAQAYEQNGVDYYPKLVSAVPFTPVTGPRLLASSDADKTVLVHAAVQFAQESGVSSLHVLFPSESDVEILRSAGLLLRESVQFHWVNHEYKTYEQFLGSMTREKRKKIKQDNRRVADAGVTFRPVTGEAITKEDLDFFYTCYKRTYESHYSSPYLTKSFFAEIQKTMSRNLLLIIAEQGGEPIAVALNFVGPDAMYGRYWGTTKFVSGLHFELCYMQAIAYCIETSIPVFEGGAQGEHKLSRGLEPTPTWSAHWIADVRFESAIEEFLGRETAYMNDYIDELTERAPFKRAP